MEFQRDNDEKLDEMERGIHEMIRFHREQYEKAIKPLIDHLVQIQSLRTGRWLVTSDELKLFSLR